MSPSRLPVQRQAVPGCLAGAEEQYAINKVRRHPICLAGAPSRYIEAREKVTQPVKGSPEDLTVTGSSDRGKFQQCEVTKSCRGKVKVGRREDLLGQQLGAAPQKDPNTK